MSTTFFAALTPMLMLFTCIAIGYILRKTNILPHTAAQTLAKLTTWVFMPALNFGAMSSRFTVSSISAHGANIILSTVCVLICLIIAKLLARIFIREDNYERCVYEYALTFGNSGYVGDPMALALFGAGGLAFYKVACIPIMILIYTWGANVLVPKEQKRSNSLIKNILNAPMVSIFIGALVGISGLGEFLYSAPRLEFIVSTVNTLSSCMGPAAMILAGITIASYDFGKMIKNKKVYIATALRLIVLPIIILGMIYGLKELSNLLLGTNIDNTILFLLFFAIAAPLGLNTVVFPEAYGGDPSTGASMAMISHTLCVITIPLMYALLTLVFGPAPIFN